MPGASCSVHRTRGKGVPSRSIRLPESLRTTPAKSRGKWICAHTSTTQTRTIQMATRNDCKCNHEFVLVLSGISTLDDRIANALLGAGCDDATISLRFGTVYLSFDREASSLQEAILT